MIWIIYEEFKKKKISHLKLLKGIKLYQWMIALILFCICGLFIFLSISSSNILFFIGYILIAVIIGLYLGNNLKKIKNKNFGSDFNIFCINKFNLNKILKTNHISNHNQIEILIQEIDDILATLQISKNIEEKINQMILSLSPFIIVFIEYFLEKDNNEALLITIVCIMIVYGFYLMLKAPIREVFDSQYNNMNELKRHLRDIQIFKLKERK